jgi:2-polyprenyl-3-methyl-5-hydroxy-6-metoxy-1,4-benzoquinol methylase
MGSTELNSFRYAGILTSMGKGEKMKTLESTGERYLPWMNDPATSYEHWHRYAYASQLVSGKRVLDLACGEGYGSALLARKARLVVGIDIDEQTVKHAQRKYRHENTRFIIGSVANIPILDIQFDAIVCFETIEHIREHEELLREAKRLLAPGGFFVVSTPNKPEYRKVEPSNQFHVNELDLAQFSKLLSKHFRHLQLLGQRVYANSCMWPLAQHGSRRISEFLIDHNSEEFFYSETDNRNPLYFIAVSSDSDAVLQITGAVLVDISNSLLKEKDRVQNEQEATIQSQRGALTWREEQVGQLRTDIEHLQGSVNSRDEALAWRESQLEQYKKEVDYLAEQLYALQSGRAWKMVQSFLRVRDRLLPINSSRRKIYERILDIIKPR